jgi:hypothetical protein
MSKRLLNVRDTAVLAALLEADRPLNAAALGEASGIYPNGRPQTWAELGRLLAHQLGEVRLVAKAGRNPLRYEITERGRIALALHRAIEARKLRRAAAIGSVRRGAPPTSRQIVADANDSRERQLP